MTNPITLDLMLEYITHGHAYAKHAEGLGESLESMQGVNAFSAPRSNAVRSHAAESLGPNLGVQTPDDLQAYARSMLEDPNTRGFVKTEAGNDFIHLYNSTDNTYMILNPLDRDLGTINRYPGSEASFTRNLTDAQATASVRTFDNARTPGQALTEVQDLATTLASRSHVRALDAAPGVAANATPAFAGTNNLTANGISDTYTHTSTLRHSGLEDGVGFVAAIDDRGRPSQMFLLDETTNAVTEINGRNVTVHTFDGVAEAERAAAARQFFDSKNIHSVETTQDGLRGLTTAFQNNTPDVFARQIGELDGVSRAGIPLAGNGTDNVVANTVAGRGTITVQAGYSSVGDAARAMVGFSDAEAALAYNHIPGNIDATRLADLNLTPEVTAAITELSEFKGVAAQTLQAAETAEAAGDAAKVAEHGAEAVGYVREFDTIFAGLDATTRSGVIDALSAVSRSPAVDVTRGAAVALDAVDAAGDLATLARGARAGRLGLNMSKAGIITTVVTTSLAVGATAYANDMVLDIADQLHNSGHLSDAAYEDYKTMMESTGPMLTGQAADPTPLAIPGMAIVERIAYNDFQEFSDKHQLPQNIHAMLSPSIVAGQSLRGEIGSETFRTIPTSTEGQPASIHDLIQARHAVDVAQDAYYEKVGEHQPQNEFARAFLNASSGGMGGMGGMSMGGAFSGGQFRPNSEIVARANPEVMAADAQLNEARQTFQTEFDRALNNPESARAVAGLLSTDQLYDIVTATAEFNADTQNPLVQQYLQAQTAEESWGDYVGMGTRADAQSDAEDALKENPDAMRDYLAEIFVSGAQPQTSPALEAGSHGSIEMPNQSLPEDGYDVIEGGYSDPGVEYEEKFVMGAGILENAMMGEELDATERYDITTLLSSTAPEDAEVVEALVERYPDQATEFMQSTPEEVVNYSDAAPDMAYSTDNSASMHSP